MSNVYGNGTSTASVKGYDAAGTAKGNVVIEYYDRAGINVANAVNIFGQFADSKQMPKRSGKTFKVSKYMHMADRVANAAVDADFAKHGYMTNRTLKEYSEGLFANSGNDSIRLSEGATTAKERTLQKITLETTLARFGEIMYYTDEVQFSLKIKCKSVTVKN